MVQWRPQFFVGNCPQNSLESDQTMFCEYPFVREAECLAKIQDSNVGRLQTHPETNGAMYQYYVLVHGNVMVHGSSPG